MEIEPKDLKKLSLVALFYCTEELIKEGIIMAEDPKVNISPFVSFLKGEYTVQVKHKIWGRNDQTYHFDWYASWWQELRHKILPNWWLEKHPSKWETKRRIQAVSTYPTLRFKDDPIIHKAAIHFESR